MLDFHRIHWGFLIALKAIQPWVVYIYHFAELMHLGVLALV